MNTRQTQQRGNKGDIEWEGWGKRGGEMAEGGGERVMGFWDILEMGELV